VNWILELENHATFSLNAEHYLSYRRNLEAFYKGVRWRWGGKGSIVKRPSAMKVVEEIPRELEHLPPPIVETTANFIAYDRLAVNEGLPGTPYPVSVNYALRSTDCPVPPGAVRLRAETDTEKQERLLKRLESGLPVDAPELIKLIPADSNDHAIEIMADVRAYWQGTLWHGLVLFLFAHFFLLLSYRSCIQALCRLYSSSN